MGRIGITDSAYYEGVAEKIREKLGVSEQYAPSQLAEKVVAVYDKGYEVGSAEGGNAEESYQQGYQEGKAEAYAEVESVNAELETTLNGGDTGGKGYYDKFWDALQNYGERVEYRFAFYQWAAEYIRPKYKVTTVGGDIQSIFAGASKLKKVEKEYFSFSPTSTGSNNYMFLSCTSLLIIEDIGLFANTNNYGTFQGCFSLHTIEVFRVSEDSVLDNAFLNCLALENITIEGTIGKNIDFKSCTKLSKASIANVIDHLSTTASGKTATFSKTAVETAFGSTTGAEWTALKATRSNWTISLV